MLGVCKRIKEAPWPEPFRSKNEKIKYQVRAVREEVKGEQLLVVTFLMNNEGTRFGWDSLTDWRLVCSQKRRDYAVVTLDERTTAQTPYFKTCFTDIDEDTERLIGDFLAEDPETEPPKGKNDLINHNLYRLNTWCVEAREWQKKQKEIRREEIEEEAYTLCPDELPEGLIEFIQSDVLEEDRVLVYKRGNVRGRCFCCGQKVKAQGERFRQNYFVHCPECGMKVLCVLEGGQAYKASYVGNVAAFQMGTDGKTLFIRQWRLNRDQSAQWEDIPKFLHETVRYAIRGRKAARWNKEYKYKSSLMTAKRADYDGWTRMHGLQNYDGGYYFYFDQDQIAGTILQYAEIEAYQKAKLLRSGPNPIKYALCFARFPVIEFLFKAGYHGLLRDEIQGTAYRSAIRWTADKLKDAFRIPLRLLRQQRPEWWSMENLKKMTEVWRDYGAGRSDRELFAIWELRREEKMNFEIELELLAATNAEKVCAYLKAETEKNPDVGKGVYGDYISGCVQLGINLREKTVLFPQDLMTAHDNVMAAAKPAKDKTAHKQILEGFRKQADKMRRYNYSEERLGLMIRVAEEPKELVREGTALSHCVGKNGYIEQMSRAEITIFLLRRTDAPEEPYYTVDLRNKAIYQCRTKHNQSYEKNPKVKAFVDRWIACIRKGAPQQKKNRGPEAPAPTKRKAG